MTSITSYLPIFTGFPTAIASLHRKHPDQAQTVCFPRSSETHETLPEPLHKSGLNLPLTQYSRPWRNWVGLRVTGTLCYERVTLATEYDCQSVCASHRLGSVAHL